MARKRQQKPKPVDLTGGWTAVDLDPAARKARFVLRATGPDGELHEHSLGLLEAVSVGMVRDIRHARGCNQGQFADQMGASLPTLSKWERGTASPQGLYRKALVKRLRMMDRAATVYLLPEVRATIRALADCLRCSPNELVTETLRGNVVHDTPPEVMMHSKDFARYWLNALRRIMLADGAPPDQIEERVALWAK